MFNFQICPTINAALDFKDTNRRLLPSILTNLKKMKRVISLMQIKLTEKQQKLFRKSIFGHFSSIKKIRFSGMLVHNLLLRQVVKKLINIKCGFMLAMSCCLGKQYIENMHFTGNIFSMIIYFCALVVKRVVIDSATFFLS